MSWACRGVGLGDRVRIPGAVDEEKPVRLEDRQQGQKQTAVDLGIQCH